MATSTLGHYVRFGETAFNGLDPMDSGMSGRALGNLNHIADQYAQRRIAWVSHGSTLTFAETTDDDDWGLIWSSTPFDLHVRDDGTSYRCRLRMRASSDALMGFRVALSAAGEGAAEVWTAETSNVASISVNGAAAWYAASGLLYLDNSRVRRATQSVNTIDSIGGSAIAVRWLRAQLTVWAKSDGSSTPQLSGIELDEYYSP